MSRHILIIQLLRSATESTVIPIISNLLMYSPYTVPGKQNLLWVMSFLSVSVKEPGFKRNAHTCHSKVLPSRRKQFPP